MKENPRIGLLLTPISFNTVNTLKKRVLLIERETLNSAFFKPPPPKKKKQLFFLEDAIHTQLI